MLLTRLASTRFAIAAVIVSSLLGAASPVQLNSVPANLVAPTPARILQSHGRVAAGPAGFAAVSLWFAPGTDVQVFLSSDGGKTVAIPLGKFHAPAGVPTLGTGWACAIPRHRPMTIHTISNQPIQLCKVQIN